MAAPRPRAAGRSDARSTSRRGARGAAPPAGVSEEPEADLVWEDAEQEAPVAAPTPAARSARSARSADARRSAPKSPASRSAASTRPCAALDGLPAPTLALTLLPAPRQLLARQAEAVAEEDCGLEADLVWKDSEQDEAALAPAPPTVQRETPPNSSLRTPSSALPHLPRQREAPQEQAEAPAPRPTAPAACLDLVPLPPADWVVVPEPNHLVSLASRVLAHRAPTVTALPPPGAGLALVAGAAGLLAFGPLTGLLLAAGAARAAADTLARQPGRRVAGGAAQAADASEMFVQVSDAARAALRQAIREVGPRVALAQQVLNGTAMAERDGTIQRLRAQLADTTRSREAERAELTRALECAEAAGAEVRELLSQELAAASLAKDEELGKLTAELEAAEAARERDTAKLSRELEAAEEKRREEVRRLASELAVLDDARRDEVARLELELDAAGQLKDEEVARLELELAVETQAKDEEVARLGQYLCTAEVAWEVEKRELKAAVEVAEHARAAERDVFSSELLKSAQRRSRDDGQNKCCVCMERQREVVFLPCRHVCCCQGCAADLKACPMDRREIVSRISFIVA